VIAPQALPACAVVAACPRPCGCSRSTPASTIVAVAGGRQRGHREHRGDPDRHWSRLLGGDGGGRRPVVTQLAAQRPFASVHRVLGTLIVVAAFGLVAHIEPSGLPLVLLVAGLQGAVEGRGGAELRAGLIFITPLSLAIRERPATSIRSARSCATASSTRFSRDDRAGGLGTGRWLGHRLANPGPAHLTTPVPASRAIRPVSGWPLHSKLPGTLQLASGASPTVEIRGARRHRAG